MVCPGCTAPCAIGAKSSTPHLMMTRDDHIARTTRLGAIDVPARLIKRHLPLHTTLPLLLTHLPGHLHHSSRQLRCRGYAVARAASQTLAASGMNGVAVPACSQPVAGVMVKLATGTNVVAAWLPQPDTPINVTIQLTSSRMPVLRFMNRLTTSFLVQPRTKMADVLRRFVRNLAIRYFPTSLPKAWQCSRWHRQCDAGGQVRHACSTHHRQIVDQ